MAMRGKRDSSQATILLEAAEKKGFSSRRVLNFVDATVRGCAAGSMRLKGTGTILPLAIFQYGRLV